MFSIPFYYVLRRCRFFSSFAFLVARRRLLLLLLPVLFFHFMLFRFRPLFSLSRSSFPFRFVDVSIARPFAYTFSLYSMSMLTALCAPCMCARLYALLQHFEALYCPIEYVCSNDLISLYTITHTTPNLLSSFTNFEFHTPSM